MRKLIAVALMLGLGIVSEAQASDEIITVRTRTECATVFNDTDFRIVGWTTLPSRRGIVLYRLAFASPGAKFINNADLRGFGPDGDFCNSSHLTKK